MTGDQLEPPPPESPWVQLEEDLADAADVGDQVDQLAADLFGAPASSADGYMFDPLPVVTVNGVDLATGPAGNGLVVLDGVTVTWGRENILDQPDPATGSLQVWDPTGTWATSQDRRGLSVTARYEGEYVPGSSASGVYFRGRIGSPITLSRETKVLPDGREVTGTLVDLPLEGALVDLANRVPTVAWPAETLGARAVRVQADILATGQGGNAGYNPPPPVSAVVVRDFWETPNVAPVAAANQVSLLDHLVALYDSSGADRMTYLPDTRVVAHLVRKEWPSTTRGTAGLFRYAAGTAGQARAGQGVFARSYAWLNTATGLSGANLYLDGQALEYDPADGISQPVRITRAQVTHPDEANGYATRTTEKKVAGVDEAVSGVRTARLESLVAWNAWADVARDDVESMVRREGSQWVLQPVRLLTRKMGGFESLAQAQFLLQGAESDTVVFLERTWLPALGLRPLYGLQGGTIAYRDGGWDLSLSLAPVTTPSAQHAITWSEIDAGAGSGFEVQWWDDDHPNGMNESLTLDDLGHVATGLGVTTANMGPNTGWDTFQ